MRLLVVLAIFSILGTSFASENDLAKLADYYHSFNRADDSSLLGGDLFRDSWHPRIPLPNFDYSWTLENKAQPDECFFGVDVPSNPPNAPCPPNSKGTNKTNQGYAWSAVKTGNNVFWGTVANYVCLASFAEGASGSTGAPTLTPDLACLNTANPTTGIPNDYRPPQIWYRLSTNKPGVSTEISLQILKTAAAELLNTTLGFRAAGYSNGVVLFAGASLSGKALNFFAFTPTGTFIGATSFAAFTDVRKFSTLGADTYVAVFSPDGDGYILRYEGSVSSPFAFVVVGKVLGQPAELIVDGTRLLIGTWAGPSVRSGPQPGRLILSPAINALPALAVASDTAAVNALLLTAGYVVVWDVRSYEPDPVTAYSLGTSDIALSTDGWFYWGTFQFPPQPLIAFVDYYGAPTSNLSTIEAFLGTHRATSVFRGKQFENVLSGKPPVIELLYGERYYPVYSNATGTGKWEAKPNNLNATPIYGRSGFGNVANVYVWSATTYQDEVLLGTFDETFLFISEIQGLLGTSPDTYNLGSIFSGRQVPLPGADLYAFSANKWNPYEPATWVTLTGLDNYVNYGLRNIFSDAANPKDDRWITTANPFNLNSRGGWELYQFTKRWRDE